MKRTQASVGKRWECFKTQRGEQGWGGAKAEHRDVHDIVINNVRQERNDQNV